MNDLKGASAFFPSYKGDHSPTQIKQQQAPADLVEQTNQAGTPAKVEDDPGVPPVPQGVPPPVRGTVPRTPKIKRAIRQRQPFDIFEDQYVRLKQIADAEREFVDGRGMSQMVREAIDNYLNEHFPSSK